MLVRCIQREIRLCFYHRLSILNAMLFLLVIASLYPLAISVEPKTLQLIGPGIIWLCALLSMMLSMQDFFTRDYRDGSLDYLILMPMSLTYYVISKVLVHWIYFILPLLFLTPFIGLFYQLSIHTIVIVMLGLLLGTPSFMLIAAILSALTLQLQHNSLLILLMAMPLYVPILIFGTVAATDITMPHWPIAAFSFMSAILVLAVILLPTATGVTLKLSIKQ